MNGPGSPLLYQDEAAGSVLKLVFVIVPAALLGVSVYLRLSGESSAGLAMLLETFIIALIFWLVFPRKYQVYQDHLRIMLGGPFSIKIGFDKIKAIEVTNRTFATANFVTTITKTYVIIIKKRGLSIAITPKSKELFVDKAEQALSQWVKTREVDSPVRITR